MSEMFDGYERQYCELSTNLSRKCTSAASALNGGSKSFAFPADCISLLSCSRNSEACLLPCYFGEEAFS